MNRGLVVGLLGLFVFACAGPQRGEPETPAGQEPALRAEASASEAALDDVRVEAAEKTGRVLQLFRYNGYPCALLRDGIRCWGGFDATIRGSFKQVVVGRGTVVLSNEGEAHRINSGTSLNPAYLTIPGKLRALAGEDATHGLLCAIVEPDGHIECNGSITRLEGSFEGLTVGLIDSMEVVCGLDATGVTCSQIFFGKGTGTREPLVVAQGKFKEIVGNCGIRSTGELECWWGERGKARYSDRTFPTFERLFSARAGTICGVTKDGESGCWGAEPNIVNVSGKFESVLVVAGLNYGCGVRAGRVECWGAVSNFSTPPEDIGSYREELTSPALAQKLAAGNAPKANTSAPPQSRCEKQVDFKNFLYPASKLSAQPFELTDGRHRITTKKVDPNTNFFGASEIGTEHRLSGVRWVDLGTGPGEIALVAIEQGDFNVYHGNSPAAAEPYVWYAAKVDASCKAEIVGSVYVEAQEDSKFERQMLILTHDRSKQSRAYAVREGKFQEVGTGAAFAPTPEAKPVCTKAESLAKLSSFQGSRGHELINADPCVAESLARAVGSRKTTFAEASSFGFSELRGNGGYLLADSCQVHACGVNRSAIAISLTTGEVFAAVVPQGSPILWLGSPAPEPFKRLVAELKEAVDE